MPLWSRQSPIQEGIPDRGALAQAAPDSASEEIPLPLSIHDQVYAATRAALASKVAEGQSGILTEEYLEQLEQEVRATSGDTPPEMAVQSIDPAASAPIVRADALLQNPVKHSRGMAPVFAAGFLVLAMGVALGVTSGSVALAPGSDDAFATLQNARGDQVAAAGTDPRAAPNPSLPTDPGTAPDPGAVPSTSSAPSPASTAGPTGRASPGSSTSPAPTSTATSTATATAGPTATPTATPSPAPTSTPTPTLYATWSIDPPAPPMFRVQTLPDATCTVTEPTRGTSRVFPAGSAGVAVLNWNSPKWAPGTYQVTATCTLGANSATTPTRQVEVA